MATPLGRKPEVLILEREFSAFDHAEAKRKREELKGHRK